MSKAGAVVMDVRQGLRVIWAMKPERPRATARANIMWLVADYALAEDQGFMFAADCVRSEVYWLHYGTVKAGTVTKLREDKSRPAWVRGEDGKRYCPKRCMYCNVEGERAFVVHVNGARRIEAAIDQDLPKRQLVK